MPTPTSGFGAYAKFGIETTYATPVSATRAFGQGLEFSINAKNNLQRVYGLGSRNASTVATTKFDGSASADFVLASGNFWRMVFGSVADSGAGPYTHTYSESNTIPSMTIEAGVDLDTDAVRTLAGCIVNSATISAAVGELVKVKLDMMYANEALTTTYGSVVAESEEPFQYAQGTVELPSGTTIANVQSFELTITNNIDLVYGLGSRFAQKAPAKQREYGIKATVVFEDSYMLTKLYGQAASPVTGTVGVAGATLVLTFTNGLAGTSLRRHVLTLNNVYVDEHSINLKVDDVLKQDITGFALSGGCIVSNNSSLG